MNLFLKSLWVRVAKVITKEFIEPHSDENTWFEEITKDYEANAKAQYALTLVLNDDDLSRNKLQILLWGLEWSYHYSWADVASQEI